MNLKPLIILAVIIVGALGTFYLLNDKSSPTGVSQGTEQKAEQPRELRDAKATTETAETDFDATAWDKSRETIPGVERGKLTGRLVDEDGVAVAGVSVHARAKPEFDFANFDGLTNDMGTALRKMRERIGKGIEVTTGTDGRFELTPGDGEDTKQLSLRLRARGYQVADQTSKHPGAKNLDVGDLLLVRGAVIAGRVFDSYNQPVAGARVRRTLKLVSAFENLHFAGKKHLQEESEAMAEATGQSMIFNGGSKEPTALTDEHGAFEMPHAKPGTFSLRISHPDHPIQMLTDQKVEVGQVIGDIVVVFTRAATISGTITDVPEGTAGVFVMARSVAAPSEEKSSSMFGLGSSILLDQMGPMLAEYSTEIAANGSFTLRGLDAAKQYRIWAVQDKGLAQAHACADEKLVRAGAQNVELEFQEGITVSFRVVTEGDDPITRLRVETGNNDPSDWMSMVTNASKVEFRDYEEGRVELINLRLKNKKKVFVRIAAAGYTTLEHPMPKLPVTGNIDLGTIVMHSAPTVEVQVIDAQSGKPISGATVALALKRTERRGNSPRARAILGNDEGATEGDFRSAIRAARGTKPHASKTDETGTCVLNGFPDALCEITVTTENHATETGAPFTISAGEKITRKIALHRGGLAQILVVDANGDPVENVAVEHREDGEHNSNRSSEDGVASFDHLHPGVHQFRLQAKKNSPFDNLGGAVNLRELGTSSDSGSWQSLDITDNATVKLTLVKRGVGSLSGIVRENGRALRGARVKILAGVSDSGAMRGEAVEEMAESMAAMFGGPGGSKNSGKTGGDGKYSLADISIGDHRLRITHKSRVMPTIVTLRVHEGDNEFDVDLTTTVITGLVLDPDGEPVDRAQVSIAAAESKGSAEQEQAMEMINQMMGSTTSGSGIKTDEDGMFTLRGVAAGKAVRVRVKATGFAAVTSSELTLTAGETRTGVKLHLIKAGRVKVTVISKNTEAKNPLFSMSGIQATYKGSDAGVAPSMQFVRDGKCTINGLRPGTWELELKGMRSGGETQKKTIEVVAGEVTRVSFDE